MAVFSKDYPQDAFRVPLIPKTLTVCRSIAYRLSAILPLAALGKTATILYELGVKIER